MTTSYKPVLAPVLLAVALLAAPATQAALHDRGNGMIYDDLIDLTWIQDTNLAHLYGFGSHTPGQPQFSGFMSFAVAKTWVKNELLMELPNGQAIGGWRLPAFRPVDGLAINLNRSFDGSTDAAYNIGAPGSAHPGSTVSELSHLFFVTLGNKAWCDVGGQCPQSGFGPLNTGPFLNVAQYNYYWIEPAAAPTDVHAQEAWGFTTQWGSQDFLDANFVNADVGRAWAVHDGDIAAVPEPGTWLLMLAGLTALARRAAASAATR